MNFARLQHPNGKTDMWGATRGNWSFIILHDGAGYFATYRDRSKVISESSPQAVFFVDDRELPKGTLIAPDEFCYPDLRSAMRASEAKYWVLKNRMN